MICQGEICQAVALAKTHPSLLQRNFQPVIDLTGLNFTENAPQLTGMMTFCDFSKNCCSKYNQQKSTSKDATVAHGRNKSSCNWTINLEILIIPVWAVLDTVMVIRASHIFTI